MRRICKNVKIGNQIIGNENRILVQSMLSVPSNNIEDNVSQAIRLENAGCDDSIVAHGGTVADFEKILSVGVFASRHIRKENLLMKR